MVKLGRMRYSIKHFNTRIKADVDPILISIFRQSVQFLFKNTNIYNIHIYIEISKLYIINYDFNI